MAEEPLSPIPPGFQAAADAKPHLIRLPMNTHPLFEDLSGRRFSRLIAVAYAGRIGRQSAYFCTCDCGGKKVVIGAHLAHGKIVSCGCRGRQTGAESLTTHGKSGTREHAIWRGMKSRCSNPNVADYEHYGARGIEVCARWTSGDGSLTGFECFLADMGHRPSPQHTVERRDNDGPYSPANCVWATRKTQAHNTRRTVSYALGDQVRTLHEWAAEAGVPAKLIRSRLSRGWTLECALTEPLKGQA